MEIPEGIRDCHPELYSAITDRGQRFPYRVTELPPMDSNRCFGNAQLTALKYKLLYAEGFARDVEGCWRHHGWNVDAEGYVVDVTSPAPESQYIGVTFTPMETARRLKEMVSWSREQGQAGFVQCFFVPPAKRSYVKGTNPRIARHGGVVYRPGRMTEVIDPDELP